MWLIVHLTLGKLHGKSQKLNVYFKQSLLQIKFIKVLGLLSNFEVSLIGSSLNPLFPKISLRRCVLGSKGSKPLIIYIILVTRITMTVPQNGLKQSWKFSSYSTVFIRQKFKFWKKWRTPDNSGPKKTAKIKRLLSY